MRLPAFGKTPLNPPLVRGEIKNIRNVLAPLLTNERGRGAVEGVRQQYHSPTRTLTHVFILLLLAQAARAGPSLDEWKHLPPAQQAQVIGLARRAFDAYALRREVIDPPSSLPPILKERVGVFVSTMRNGAPRTCMGSLYPLEANAAREIISSAAASAGRDRRFSPVRPAELRSLVLIVSIVGNLRPISAADANNLDPTRDGLAARYGDRYGVVLSGETGTVDRMLRWARIRAGADPTAPVDLFQLDTVRFVEKR